MDSIVNFILKLSKLEMTLIKITQPTADSFVMGFNCRVTNTGPISATMAPMVVDLTFNGASFGKLQLPEVKTSSKGAEVNIESQEIKIINMDAFKAFVRALMLDDDLVLTLDNGDCTIKALGMKSKVTYKKDINLKGMHGPPCTIKATDASTNTMTVQNDSVLEIDHGISMFQILDASGNTVAELKGPMAIKRGSSDITMNITRKGKPAGSEATLVGIGCESNAWTNETLRYIRTPIQLPEKFVSMC